MAPGEPELSRKRKRSSSDKLLNDHELERTKSVEKVPHRAKEQKDAQKRKTSRNSVGEKDTISAQDVRVNKEKSSGEKKRRLNPSDGPDLGNGKKRKSKSKKKLKDSSALVKASLTVAFNAKKNKTGTSLKKASKIRKSARWYLSASSGGRFLDSGPLFSQDESYLLLASQHTLNVYSVETSLLIRAIAIPKQSRIRAYALSCVNPSHAYVATSKKRLIQFDWTSGKEISSFELDQDITEIQAVAAENPIQDVLYTIGYFSDGDRASSSFAVSKIMHKDEQLINKPDVHRLWKSPQPAHLLRVVGNGEQILFASDDKLTIGVAEKTQSAYLWREIQCSDPLSSLDVRQESLSVSGKKKKKNQGPKPTLKLNIAAGGVRGAIFVYQIDLDDLRGRDGTTVLKPRILHWHREAVEATRWSRDGLYILSGGHESVFILWQLETGKRQELPHLPSRITGITVSPTGTSYGLQLADNSVIVMSTSELQAITHVAGIQSRTFTYANPAAPKLKTVTSKAEASTGNFGSWSENPAVVNPLDPTQIFVAVPSVQDHTGPGNFSSAPYIQTFDAFSSRHVSRQPLTRNNATVKAIGPDANKLIEPNIRFMQISGDGRWLATVDEWLPPASDVNPFADGSEDISPARKDRLESYLKFWLWNEDQGNWMLETRIDMPHRSENDPSSTSVLDLVSDPSSLGFATIGEDGFVRIWRPKTRYEDGAVRCGAHTEGSVSWSCRHAIELEGAALPNEDDINFDPKSPPLNAKLAFSHDGSILAAAQERSSPAALLNEDDVNLDPKSPLLNAKLALSHDSSILVAAQEHSSPASSGVVHLIEATTGSIHSSLASMYRSDLAGLGFCGQFLVVLSNDLVVWDVTINQLAFGFRLDTPSLPGTNAAKLSKLAINSASTAFAIAVPAQGKWLKPTNLRSHVLVFEPSSPTPVFANKLPDFVLSLMSVPKSPSFIVLNSVAEIGTLAPRSGAALSLQAAGNTKSMALKPSEESTLNLQPTNTEAMEGDASTGAEVPHGRVETEDLDIDDDAPVVRKEQLEDALDLGPAFALPPPRTVFDIVAKLYAGKPRN